MILGFEQHFLHYSPGGEYASDFSVNQFPGSLGVFHLLANGNPVALSKKPGDIPVDGVIGHPAHRDGGPGLVFVSSGQGDLQFAGSHNSVFIEHLIEVPQAEENHLSGKPALYFMVLLHHGGQIFHARALTANYVIS